MASYVALAWDMFVLPTDTVWTEIQKGIIGGMGVVDLQVVSSARVCWLQLDTWL